MSTRIPRTAKPGHERRPAQAISAHRGAPLPDEPPDGPPATCETQRAARPAAGGYLLKGGGGGFMLGSGN
jgi:hypothetical protein